MRRSLLTVLIVAAISGWISRGERASGLSSSAGEWVRTADGWRSRTVVEPREVSAPPAVHPAVIAALQLGASLFFLIAFPARVSVPRGEISARSAVARRRAMAPAAAGG